jgi:hypothetical protein
MPWVRIDDHYDENPKIAQAGPLCVALWLAGLAYCNRNLTDGFIPWGTARGLVSWSYLEPEDDKGRRKVCEVGVSSGMAGEDVGSEYVIELLKKNGMWIEVPGGYKVHDYEDFQPTKEEVLALREERSRAGSKGARSRWGDRDNGKNGKTDDKSLAKPMAKSCPVPVPNKKEPSLNHDGFDQWWGEYPKKVGKQEALREWDKIHPTEELQAALRTALATQKRTVKAMRENDREHILDPCRWLKYRRWEDELLPSGPAEIVYPKL